MRHPKPLRPLLVTDKRGTTYELPPLPGMATPIVTQPSLFDSVPERKREEN